jgi:1,4-alpha-glucan branching enzyme
VLAYYHDIIRLRRNLDGVSPGLAGPNMTSHVIDNTAKVLAYHRWGAGTNDQVMVVLNFSNTSISNYSIGGFPVDGNWYVNLNSDWTNYSADFGNYGSMMVHVSGGNGQVNIAPYSALIISQRALPQLDSDGDGLLNGWEQKYYGDPVSAVATADDDNDGMNNLQEQAADTDPHSANSVLKFISVVPSAGQFMVRWKGGQAARQIIEKAGQITGSWTPIYTNNPPTLVTNSLNITQTGVSNAFYRIRIAP